MRRSQEDLEQALAQQVRFLETSCNAFDAGDEMESLRIATTLRVLLHDTRVSQSLLTQLGIKSTVKFVDSASPIDPVKTGKVYKGRDILSISGMPGFFAVSPTINGMKLIAPKNEAPHAKGLINFEEWWTNGSIPGSNGSRHSRSWLIKEMANKEGGAHVDPEITQGYAELRNTNMGMVVTSNGIDGFINSPADVTIRQIAWEFLESLRRERLII